MLSFCLYLALDSRISQPKAVSGKRFCLLKEKSHWALGRQEICPFKNRHAGAAIGYGSHYQAQLINEIFLQKRPIDDTASGHHQPVNTKKGFQLLQQQGAIQAAFPNKQIGNAPLPEIGKVFRGSLAGPGPQ